MRVGPGAMLIGWPQKASEQDPKSLNEATKISATVHDDHISSIIEMLGEHLRKSKCDINSGLAFHTHLR